jgi:hypothetical protein
MPFSRRSPVGVPTGRNIQPLIGAAVRAVTDGFTELGFSDDSPVLAIGRDTTVAARLGEQGFHVACTVIPDETPRPRSGDGERQQAPRPASVCVLDDLLGFADDPSALLKAAYDGLAPGGLLVATLGHRRGHDRPDPEVASPETPREKTSLRRQHLQTLLFREGFVSPRWRKLPGPDLLVTARRGNLAPPYSRPQRLSVIVPVYDEAATFPKMMADLLAKEIPGVEIDVIVIESNSTDGTRDLALGYAGHPRVELVLEERARGKGHAVRTGLTHAEGDFILIQDADLEYDMDDYEALLAPLRSFATGFVLGVRAPTQGAIWGIRRFSSGPRLSRLMNVGNFIFRAMFNLVYWQRLRDPFTMAKVFRRDCVHGMKLECNRFDFDWELLAKLLRAGCTPVEVPIYYRSRSFEEGKKIRIFRDSITWIVACFRYRFVRFEI